MAERGDGSYQEVGFLKCERDNRYRQDPMNLTSMWEVWLRLFVPGGSDDEEYRRILRLQYDRITPFVPMRVALRAKANGKLVCADATTEDDTQRPLIANRDAIGPWETFDLIGVED